MSDILHDASHSLIVSHDFVVVDSKATSEAYLMANFYVFQRDYFQSIPHVKKIVYCTQRNTNGSRLFFADPTSSSVIRVICRIS